ncbi:MAG: hypothetical protein RJB66_61 [Pseudomonadota bacterium]|jgi:hypothetical protein
MSRALILLFFFVASLSVRAETYQQLLGAFRTFPKSGSIEAHSYYNQKFWDESATGQAWKFGLWRVGAFAAVHGQVGARVDLYPISFVQISYQESLTSRFYETLTLNCEEIHCGGSLRRGTLKASLALAYGAIFFVPSYAQTQLTIDSDKRDFSSEEDNLIAKRTGDELATTQWALGYKQEKDRFVFLSKQSVMKFSKDNNFSQLLIWSHDYNSEINYFAGVGFFESNHVKRGSTMVAGFNWTSGDNLALF